jgi:phage terminase large subunit GpA-like protein
MVRVTPQRPVPLSAWIEDNIRLPAGISAVAGPIKLHPYQRAIADAIADPKVERVTVIKSARVGFTTLLVGAIAHFIVREPSPILVLMPTESDARGLMVDDIEGLFAESPALADHLPMPHPGRSDRNTLVHRIFDKGSLKIVAAGAPRNMRRHSARVLLIDEVDACQATAEGDAVSLALQRTLTWPNRKIVIGGTPLDKATSAISRLYAESDRRVWEVPCPACGGWSEIKWEHIEWPECHPEDAVWRCPHCSTLTQENHKAAMTRAGRWRAQNTGISQHVGFRINSLVSLLPSCTWGKLAAKYASARGDPSLMRVFMNTDLGLPWAEEGDEVDASAVAARAEPFSLDAIPEEVLALTAGVDCQDDRLEAVICGWTRKGGCLVLGHETIWGAIDDDLTWRQLDDLLRATWPHPLGGRLKVDACAIDSGDGGHAATVVAFCRSRAARRVMAIKGASGLSRLPLVASKSKMKGGGRLWIVGSDSVKSRIFDQLQRGTAIRFSDTLTPVFYEQLASERVVVRQVGGKPVRRFERIRGMRAEALDALTYAHAARSALTLHASNFDRREDDLRMIASAPAKPPAPTIIRSQWMERGRL